MYDIHSTFLIKLFNGYIPTRIFVSNKDYLFLLALFKFLGAFWRGGLV